MREFDHNGLMLAEYQAKIFEKSTELGCSSPIFLRRFFKSDFLKKLDKNETSVLSFDPKEALESIIEQFGDTNYGKEKYSNNSLFWMGYMYRYIAYTREVTTEFVVKLFDYKLMNDVYYSFHTQDPEWCIRSLLEIKNLTEDVFDQNKRLKNIICVSLYL